MKTHRHTYAQCASPDVSRVDVIRVLSIAAVILGVVSGFATGILMAIGIFRVVALFATGVLVVLFVTSGILIHRTATGIVIACFFLGVYGAGLLVGYLLTYAGISYGWPPTIATVAGLSLLFCCVVNDETQRRRVLKQQHKFLNYRPICF